MKKPPFKPFGKLGFVRAARSAVNQAQEVVQRIGNAIIGGDFTGNARGDYALDIQVLRGAVTDVASGASAIAFGSYSEASGENSVAIGFGDRASGAQSVAVGVGNLAEQVGGVAFGSGVECGVNAVGVGINALPYGENSVAVGYGAEADNARSIALGYGAAAVRNDECAIAADMLLLRVLAADPSSVGDGDAWLVRSGGIAAGNPIGLLLSLTYANPVGGTLQLSVRDGSTTKRVTLS